MPVSYTHLDVYKRQAMCSVSSAGFADEMEVATIDLISAMFFIMVLDDKV